MANEIPIKLAFQGDMSAVKKELKDLKSTLDSIVVKTSNINGFGQVDQEITKTINLAAQLQGQLQAATTKSGNLKLDVLAKEFKKSGVELETYVTQLRRLAQQGYPEAGAAADQLLNQIRSAYTPINQMSGALSRVFNNLTQDIIKTFNYALINKFTGAIRGAFYYAQNLDRSLNDIRIVTNLGVDQMADFAKQANKAAMALGATTLEYTKGALIYYQQGLSGEDVIERTNATIKLANTSGEAAEQISSYMTGIWNNFDKGSKSVEYYADVISYLGAVTAASNADIAEGVQAFAATAETVGLSFEYATSALTTLVDRTQQSASTIGNSLKTIFARLSSVKLGETLEDGVDLTKYTSALETVGVNVLDANGNLKEMDEILDDLGKRWWSLNNAQKVALAQTVGGVRQYNNLISLMDNYGYFKELVNDAYDSEGYLSKQNAIYLESWAAASDQVKAAWQGIYDLLIDDQFIIKVTKGFAEIVSGVGNLIDNLGGLKTLLPGIVSMMLTFGGDRITQGIMNVTTSIRDFLTFNTAKGGGGLAKELQKNASTMLYQVDTTNNPKLDDAIEAQRKMSENFVKNRQLMTQAERVMAEEQLKRNKILLDQLIATERLHEAEKARLEGEFYGGGSNQIENFDKTVSNNVVAARLSGIGFNQNGELATSPENYIDAIRNQLEISKVARESEVGKNLLEQFFELKDDGGVVAKATATVNRIRTEILDNLNTTGDKANAEQQKLIDNMIQGENIADPKGKTIETQKEFNDVYAQSSKAVKDLQNDIVALNDSLKEGSGITDEQKQQNKELLEEKKGELEVELDYNKRLAEVQQTVVNGVKEHTQKTRELTQAELEAEQRTQELLRIQEYQAKQRATLAYNLTRIAQVGTAVISIVNTMSGLIKTLGDESKTAGEKISALVSAFGTIAFQGTAIVNNLTTMLSNGLFGPALQTAVTALTKGTGTLGGVISALRTTILGFIQVAWPFIVVIGAIGAAIYVLTARHRELEKANKDAAKAAQETANAFDEAKDKYEGLKSSIEDYKDTRKSIDNLKEGTKEWVEEIEKANSNVLDLIDNFPELQKYLQSEVKYGQQILTLSQEGLEKALEQQQKSYTNARIAKYGAAMGSNSAAMDLEYYNAGQKIKYKSGTSSINGREFDIMSNIGDAILKKVVGAIDAGTMGLDLFTSKDEDAEDKLREALVELGGLTESQIDSIVNNRDAIEELTQALWDTKNKNNGLSKLLLEGSINDNAGYTSAEKSAYIALANTANLDERTDELYNTQYKNQNKTDAAKAYATMMNWDADNIKYDDKNGTATYYQNGKEVGTYSIETARRASAAQAATSEFESNAVTTFNNLTAGRGDKETQAMAGFLGGGQEGLNSVNLTADQLQALKDSAEGMSIDSGIVENWSALGYESAEEFVKKYKEALEQYSPTLLEDIDYGMEDFSKDDKEFLETYAKYLRDTYKEQELTAEQSEDIARRKMNEGKAYEDVRKNIEEYRENLKKANKGQESYVKSLDGVRKNLEKITDIDGDKFSEEFLTAKSTLDDLEKAANGDVAAFTRLQKAALKDVTVNMELLDEEGKPVKADSAFVDRAQAALDQINKQDLEIGAWLNTDAMDEEMLNFYNGMLENGALTVDQMNEIFNGFGFEPEYDFDKVTDNSTLKVGQEVWLPNADGNGYHKEIFTNEMDTNTEYFFPKINRKGTKYTAPRATAKNQKPKSSGSGSKKETKDKKSGETEKKRYEVINNKLQETNELLTEITSAEDRAFGADKVELMEDEMAALNIQLDQYNKKLAEANDWLKKDKKAMDAYGAKYDANGVITNYDQIMDQQIAIYNAAVDRYNRSAQTDADKERFEQAEKAYEKFLKAYEQYNETLDLVGELEQNVLDTIYKVQDKALEIITTQVELNVEVNDRDIELIEYLMKQLEDKAYSAADAIALLGKEAANSLDKIAGYQEGIADVLSDVNVAYDEQLQKRLQNGEIDAEEYNRLRQIGDAYAQQFLNGEISAEQYAELVHMDEAHMSKLKEYADAIKDETLKLQELRKEAYEKLGETLEQFNDDLDKQKDKIDKATSALENYRNIVDTFGKKNLGLDDDVFEQMSRAELKAAQSRAAISKTGVDEAKRAMEELEAQVNAATSEEQKRLLQEQLDKATEAYEDALDNWTGDLADAADKVAQVFDDAIDHIVDKFDESVGGLFNNLGDLQEAFDQASTLDDQYVDDYKRVYELNKLNKKIHDSIDNGVTVKSRQLLLSLQDEINKKEAEGVELSEYDLEVYQKRYELYLAQIALEEAQNAKSTVRMSRDNEGNWSYVYVADQAAMDKALDDYNDKLQQYAELNNDYIKTTQDTILSLEKEYQDALAGLDPTDPDYERKLQELQKYYNDRMAFYVQQLNNALDANKEVASYEEAEDWNVKQNFEDTLLGQLTGVASAEEYGEIFNEAVADATAAAMEKYHNYLADLDETTADIEDMAGTIAGAIEDVYDVSDEAETEANAIAETFKTAFESAIKELDAFADSYNEDIDSMSFATARLLALINKLNEIKSGQTSNTDMPLPDTAYSDAALREILGDELFNSITNGGTYDNIYGLGNRKIGVGDTGETERQYAISGLAIQGLSEALSHMAEISAAGFGDLTSFLVDHTGKLEQQVTITANFPNVVNHTEIEEAFSNLVNMAAQFANRKN